MMKKDGFRYCRMSKQYITIEDTDTSVKSPTKDNFIKYLLENSVAITQIFELSNNKLLIFDAKFKNLLILT